MTGDAQVLAQVQCGVAGARGRGKFRASKEVDEKSYAATRRAWLNTRTAGEACTREASSDDAGIFSQETVNFK